MGVPNFWVDHFFHSATGLGVMRDVPPGRWVMTITFLLRRLLSVFRTVLMSSWQVSAIFFAPE